MPLWLTIMAFCSLAIGFLCALIVLGDILIGHPQQLKIMNVVWPITPIYSGLLGLWAYCTIGRNSVEKPDAPCSDAQETKSSSSAQSNGRRRDAISGQKEGLTKTGQGRGANKQESARDAAENKDPSWQSVVTGVSHCGAGCTLGDIVGNGIVFAAGWTIAGVAVWPRIMGEFVCDLCLH